MKKKNNKKKLPRYDIGKPIVRGYQRNKGIGAASFNSLRGEDLMPEVNAMRQSLIPNAIARLGLNAQYPMQALQNMKTITNTITTPTFTSLSSPLIQSAGSSILPTMSYLALRGATRAGLPTLLNTSTSLTTPTLTPTLSGAKSLGGFLTQSPATQLSGTANATNSVNLVQPTTTSTTTSTVLNTAGKVAAGIGTAYGAYNVMNDIMHAGDTITTGLIANSRGTNTVTTAGGNTYTEKTGPDAVAAMEYEKQAATSKKVGLTMDTMGLGASIGSFFGPLGTGIGAAGGALIGGIASLFGFGNNEDDVRNSLALVNDTTALENRQSEGLAKNQDTRDAFYGNAANGKMPGFRNGKANARVSNGEVIGNFEDGYFRVPGGKNNKDTIKTHLGKEDFVISNKHGLSDYAWLTGDIPGALAALSYLQKTGQMNKYKNGRLPKYEGGRWSDAIFSMIPHGISAALNLTQLLRAQNADIYAPDFYVENPEGAKAVNTLASLRFNADPYYREAQRGLNQANWDARRLVSLGTGGRAIMQNANYAQYLNGLRDITKTYNEANNAYAEKYANALANLGATNQGRRIQANAQRHQFLQQANAARENWMAQYRKNLDTNLLNAASEYMKWGQYNDSLGIQNKMLNLYDRQAETDELKANAYINSLRNNNVQTSSTWTPPTWLQHRGYIPSTYDTSGFNWTINRTPTTKYKNGKMPKYEDGLVDTRSDTTYQGYNPNPIPWGAGLDAAGQGPLALLDGIEAASLVSNNPYLLTGIAPSPGKVTYTPEQMTKLWLKHGQEYARKNKLSTFMGPNGKMYAHMPDGKVRSFEAIGKEIRGEEPITYTAKKFKPVDHTIKKVPKVISTSKKTYNYGAITANDFK